MTDATPLGVVFVHGFRSSAKVWDPFIRLIGSDPDLDFVSPLPFTYATGFVSLHPLRRLPSFDDVADSLKVFLATETRSFDRVMLVTHSQGGLIAQRLLTRALAEGREQDLRSICGLVLFACPNSGSQLALTLRRRWLPGNPQERQLRPLDATVADSLRIVVTRLAKTPGMDSGERWLPITAYAGETDGIVTPQSAQVFPDHGVLPGDHFSIVRPTSTSDRSYSTLKKHLLAERADTDPPNRSAESRDGRSTVQASVTAGRVEGTVTGVDAEPCGPLEIESDVQVGDVRRGGRVEGVRMRSRSEGDDESDL